MDIGSDKAITKYIAKRMANGRDDREESHVFGSKHKMDAELRGKIGQRKADQIINVIDQVKSFR